MGAQTYRLCAVTACLSLVTLICLVPVQAQTGTCCQEVSRLEYRTTTETYYVGRTSGYSFSCGWRGWRRCRGTRYHRDRRTRVRARAVTVTEQVCTCCSGYQRQGGICTPICSGGCNSENGGGTCTLPETCSCNNGWTGSNCETPVCLPPCENGVCSRPGTCVCDPGWTDSRCRIDINECAQNNGACDRFCNNTEGSFFCWCGDGYNLNEDGRQCDDINECQDGNSGGCTDRCTNTRGSYQCSCRRGYEFQREDEASGSGTGDVVVDQSTDAGRPCQDVDECTIANGECEHECINTEGSFYCDCRGGHMLESNNRTCEDIPECTTGDHNCTGNAICIEAIGYFRCVCPANFRIDEDTYASCKDINECEEGISGCSQLCNNTVGGYFCSCMAGYSLLEDGRNCVGT